MKIRETLYLDNVICNTDIKDKDNLFILISELISKTLSNTTPNIILECFLKREKLGNTGIGVGVAIPHGKFKNMSVPIGVFIRLKQPIDFGASDAKPVDLVFGLLVPEEDATHHLKVLALLTEKFNQESFCEKLRKAETNEELYKLLVG